MVANKVRRAATVKDETDPMAFGVGSLAYALFYPGYMSGCITMTNTNPFFTTSDQTTRPECAT